MLWPLKKKKIVSYSQATIINLPIATNAALKRQKKKKKKKKKKEEKRKLPINNSLLVEITALLE